MRTIFILFCLSLALLVTGCQAQVRNARTVPVSITGNCGICEEAIEKAAFVKGEATADWDKDTKRAVLTFDSTRTDADAILQRIAHAGYDNERYLAPDEAYAALTECCRYERTLKKEPLPALATAPDPDHAGHTHAAQQPSTEAKPDPLAPVFEAYFQLKDALVASDAVKAKAAAQRLDAAVLAVDMGTLAADVHAVWMKVMEPLANTATAISTAKDVEAQRKSFRTLTEPMTRLVKASPGSVPVYLDHCPMYEGGSDWLSRDKAIRNPFYGAQMMTCGSVKETITGQGWEK